MSDKKIKFEDAVMARIKDGHVKLRSKYVFFAEKIGLGGGLFLSLILTAFFVNLALFYVRSTGHLEFLSFGRLGLFAFLEVFPYLWVSVAIVFLILAGFILKQYDISYKKRFSLLVFSLLVSSVILGAALAATDTNNIFEAMVLKEKKASSALRPFYGKGMGGRHYGLAGKVVDVTDKKISLISPDGLREIALTNGAIEQSGEVSPGEFIVAVGGDGEDGFVASQLKTVSGDRIPRVADKIQFKFNEKGSERCGDGDCDDFEKRMGICVRDCDSSSAGQKQYAVKMNKTSFLSIVGNGNIISEFDINGDVVALVRAGTSRYDALTAAGGAIIAYEKGGEAALVSRIVSDLGGDAEAKFRDLGLRRTLDRKDVSGKEELAEFLKNKHPEIPRDFREDSGGTVSPYQLYVTPDSEGVKDLAKKINSNKDAYEEAVSWVWVSEDTLNGVDEKWLYPEEFLSGTPNYSSNPVAGSVASDCSEQANALVSLLRAFGVAAENVRVVLGEVNFDGQTGGHAWAEIYEDGQWVALDPTSGPYYDDDAKMLVAGEGISYDYFKYAKYPAAKVWYYYNDKYFYDNGLKKGNADLPHWKEGGNQEEKIKQILFKPDKESAPPVRPILPRFFRWPN